MVAFPFPHLVHLTSEDTGTGSLIKPLVCRLVIYHLISTATVLIYSVCQTHNGTMYL